MINGDSATPSWMPMAMLIVAIITVAATIVAPLLAVLVQNRINQPKPSPEANQEKNRSQSIGGRVSKHLKAFWPQHLAIVVNIAVLIYFLSDTAPVSRLTVFYMAIATGGIFLQFVTILVISLVNHIFDLTIKRTNDLSGNVNKLIELSGENIGLMKRQMEVTQGVIDELSTLKDKTQNKQHGRLGALVDKVNKFLGG